MKLGILISGRGSNMMAIASAVDRGRLPAEIVLVLSNDPYAPGLLAAASRGIPIACVPHKAYGTRQDHEAAVRNKLLEHETQLVCLAGYMRILTSAFVQAHSGRIVNIHPSLLPAFPGLDAQRQALNASVKITGATVHLVDEQVDQGRIIQQEAVPILSGDDLESLSRRILEAEHRLYPRALRELIATIRAGNV